MKHLKMLGLLGLAATAILAVLAGSASATELTSPKGTVYTGTFSAETENGITFEGPFSVKCNNSRWEAVTEKQGPLITASGKLQNITFTECGKTTVSVNKPGTFEIHTDAASANGNGFMTSSGMEITTLFHVTLLGFPWTLHCITETQNTPIGTITGSLTTGETPKTEPAPTPDPTDAACSESVEVTSSYQITSPHYLDID
jgi:hypothetical protein